MTPNGSISCPQCGILLTVGTSSCPKCGARIQPPRQPSAADPHWTPPGYLAPAGSYPNADYVQGPPLGNGQVLWAIIISLLTGGYGGFFANGQHMKGVTAILLSLALGVSGLLTCGVGFLAAAVCPFVFFIDTIVIASRLQSGRPVRKNEWFWS